MSKQTFIIGIVSVLIHRDKMSVVPKEIFPWDLPVMESKYGGGLVEITGFSTVERSAAPDLELEFARLSKQYVPDSPEFTHFELSYGRGRDGLNRLQEAINKAVNPKVWPTKELSGAMKQRSEEEIRAEIARLQAQLEPQEDDANKSEAEEKPKAKDKAKAT